MSTAEDLSNNAPSLLVLLDEALDAGNPQLLTDVFEHICNRMAQDDPDRAEKREHLLSVVAKWDADRPEIENHDHAQKATNLSAQLRDAAKAEDSAREGAKKPFLTGGRVIDGAFKAREKTMLDARTGIDGRLTRYLRRQQEAKAAAEKLARETAEAAAKAAATATSEEERVAATAQAETALAKADALSDSKAQVRSSHGSLATTAKTYSVVIENMTLVPLDFMQLNEPKALAALKAGQKITGLRLHEELAVRVR